MSEQKVVPVLVEMDTETSVEVQKTKQCVATLNEQIKKLSQLGIKVSLSFEDLIIAAGVKASIYVNI
jgi:hypothetical protein